MTTRNLFTATAAAALLGATAASAQMLSDTIGADYDYDRFNEGFASTGYYDGLDMDGDSMLSENEYATGLYADYDRDNDVMISEEEFVLGNDRYYGEGLYEGGLFADYDADADGFLTQREFGSFYGTEYTPLFAGQDVDRDGMLNAEEFSTGIYRTADLDQDQIITVEEEGWFEGWFDGDDIDVEVREIGEVY